MWELLKPIFEAIPMIGKIIGWFEDRKRQKTLDSQIEAQEDAQILKGVKRAKDITSKPLADDILLPPAQRGAGPHNED